MSNSVNIEEISKQLAQVMIDLAEGGFQEGYTACITAAKNFVLPEKKDIQEVLENFTIEESSDMIKTWLGVAYIKGLEVGRAEKTEE